MVKRCPVCLWRVWWWHKQIVSLSQTLHEKCYWSRFFHVPAASRVSEPKGLQK